MTKVKKEAVAGTVELNEEDLKGVTGGSCNLTSAGTEKVGPTGPRAIPYMTTDELPKAK